jgi:hypothetical protein
MESGQFVVRLFKYSGAILLLVAATAKIVSGLGFAEVLKQVDPFFGMQFGHLMLVVGILELAIVANWFFSSSERFGLLPVAWLTTCLVIYRLGLWQIGWHGQCHCLGNFTDSIHVSPQVADNIMKGVGLSAHRQLWDSFPPVVEEPEAGSWQIAVGDSKIIAAKLW